MRRSRLSEAQRSVIAALAGMEPAWTLTGGGALCGYHLGHRDTRDLDLFFHGRAELEELPREIDRRLRAAGFEVVGLRSAPAFRRLEARRDGEVVVVDLVAEPVPWIQAPVEAEPGVRVDTAYEILVNKVAALYSRNAVRDLYDVQCLLAAGGDLDRALIDAQRKDGGVSGPGLAWLLERWDVRAAAQASGFDADALDAFRLELVERLLGDVG